MSARVLRATVTTAPAGAAISSVSVTDHATVADAMVAGLTILGDDATGAVRAVVDAIEMESGTIGSSAAAPTVRSTALLGAAAPGQMLVTGTAAALLAHAPDGIRLVELGAHRFHLLDRPLVVHEARGAGLVQRRIRTLDTVAACLPTPSTPLIGRVELLDEIGALLATARLTTLTGAGGSGKTRLAIEAASAATGGFDSIRWVDLGPLGAQDDLMAEVATRIGLHHVRSATIVERVVHRLRDGPQLLVLDNAEHIVDAVAVAVRELLGSCPQLRVLVTSREAIGIEGETVRAVPPLGTPAAPSVDEVEASDAGAFLLDRLGRTGVPVDLDTTTAALLHRVCHRLDGMPLALELAAARRTTLSLAQLADGLDDRFALLSAPRRGALPRQRTLEASLRWSYDLLSDDERVVLRRLAVFSGTFQPTDAAEVAGWDVADPGLVVGRLVDRSLVSSSGEGELRLLETVRCFAEDRLVESGESVDARNRHVDWLLGLAGDIARTFDGPDPAGAVATARRLLPEVRSALTHAEATRRSPDMWKLLDRLALYFFYQGDLDEALGWFDRADRLDDGGDPTASAAARVSAALLATSRGDHGEIVAALDRAFDAAQAAGDHRAQGRALVLAGAHRIWNDPATGMETLAQGLAVCDEVGDPVWSSWGACGVALALTFLGRPTEAIAELEHAELVARTSGVRRLQLDVLARRSICEYQIGRWGAAAATIHAGRTLAAGVADISVTACFDVVDAWLRVASGAATAVVEEMDRTISRYLLEGELQFIPLFVEVRSTALIAADRSAEAVEPLVELRRHPGVEWSSVYRHWLDHVLAVALLHSGRRDDARSTATRLIADAGAVGNRLDAARGRLVLAHIEEADGETRRGEQHAHDALEVLVELDARPAAVDALGIIGRLQEQLGHVLRSAAVATGVEEARAQLVTGTPPELAPLVELVRRTRGERGRPPFGWDSITPTELAVVALVADGLTNPEIADRLVVGRSTVKTHVSNTLRKLGLTSRTQLATEFRARRQSDP